jgi:hypothetical protein
MSNRILFSIIGFAVVVGIIAVGASYLTPRVEAPSTAAPIVENPEMVACTMDAMQCPDGSYIGRTGPNCEFVCPPLPLVPTDVQAQIDMMSDRIIVDTPVSLRIIESPLTLTGQAVGNWYFEASAPVSLVNWDGLIIAEGFVTAQGDWMTTEFVPFTGELTFESPYKEGDPDFMKQGKLIFQNDNPSGLPEKQYALEIPVRFAP